MGNVHSCDACGAFVITVGGQSMLRHSHDCPVAAETRRKHQEQEQEARAKRAAAIAERKAREEAFMLDLKELTVKHGVVIDGCGCCGSPFLDPAPPRPELGVYYDDRQLAFVHPDDERAWRNYLTWKEKHDVKH